MAVNKTQNINFRVSEKQMDRWKDAWLADQDEDEEPKHRYFSGWCIAALNKAAKKVEKRNA